MSYDGTDIPTMTNGRTTETPSRSIYQHLLAPYRQTSNSPNAETKDKHSKHHEKGYFTKSGNAPLRCNGKISKRCATEVKALTMTNWSAPDFEAWTMTKWCASKVEMSTMTRWCATGVEAWTMTKWCTTKVEASITKRWCGSKVGASTIMERFRTKVGASKMMKKCPNELEASTLKNDGAWTEPENARRRWNCQV